MRVMVPIDDMPYSFAALESILQRNWSEKTKFLLCRVVEENDSRVIFTKVHHPQEHNRSLAKDSDCHERATQKWLDGIADVFSGSGMDVETRVLSGEISEALCACARGWSADYIVMGSHDRKERERAWLGSIAADVAQHADCSVELVRPKNMPELLHKKDFQLDDVSQLNFVPQKILIPLDFSENSLEAIRWLCSLKGLEQAEVFLVTVVRPQATGFVSNQIGNTVEGVQPLESESMTKLNYQCNIVKRNARLYSIGVRVLRGEPGNVILEFADVWKANLIAFATRGQTNGDNSIVGSIARSLMDGAHCSTVAIKPGFSERFKFGWKERKAVAST